MRMSEYGDLELVGELFFIEKERHERERDREIDRERGKERERVSERGRERELEKELVKMSLLSWKNLLIKITF